ncbi:MAG: hypothetical protein ACOZAJ_01385, partial [Patescibacteria group bacterium]
FLKDTAASITAEKRLFGSNPSTHTVTANFATQRTFDFEHQNLSIDTGVTVDNAATVYISGAPNNTGLGTLTNRYALWVASGNAKFNDKVSIGTTSTTYALNVTGADEATLALNATAGEPAIFYDQAGSHKWEQRVGADFQLYSYTSSSWPFTILGSSGNLGIGTTNPLAKIDVVGNTMYFRDTAEANGVTIDPANGAVQQIYSDYFNAGTEQDLVLGTYANRANQLYLDTSGNVGIGTINPATHLDILGNGRQLDINASTATSTVYQRIQNGSAIGYFGVEGSVAGTFLTGSTAYATIVGAGASGVPLQFGTAGTVRATIDHLGNVGIGTASPDKKLVVQGAVTSFKVDDYVSTSYGPQISTSNDKLVLPNTLYLGDSTVKIFKSSGLTLHGDNGVSLNYYSGADLTGLRLTNTGLVGIGTTSPTALLNTKGNLSSALTGTVSVTINTATVTGVGTAFTTELAVGDSIKIGSEIFTVSAIGSATSLTLDSNHLAGASGVTAYRDPTLLAVDNGDAVNKLTVTRSGNVGIGTTSPTKRLQIQGQASETAGTVLLGVYSNGTLGTGGSLFEAQTSGGVGLRVTEIGAFQMITPSVQFAGAGNTIVTFSGIGNSHQFTSSNTTQNVTDWTFNAGKNAGGNRTAGNLFAIANNDVTKVLVDYAGNVGIGTTTPGATLHVDASSGGIIRATRLGTGVGIIQLEADG